MANLDAKALKVWDKARIVESIEVDGKTINIDTNRYRQDACNAWIEKDQYGEDHHFGWEIDHILPQAKGGTDHLDNLRPLHAKNNGSKSDNFPSYTAVFTSQGDHNINIDEVKTIHSNVLKKLKELYPNSKYL